jgi:TRAP-type C4-dicarboxylate transport system permease small subunit
MNLLAFLDTADRSLDRLMRFAIMGALCLLLLLLTYGMIVRWLPSLDVVVGYEEIIELITVWMTFVGAAVLWREGSLFRVDVLLHAVPDAVARGFDFATQGLMLCFALVFTWQGWVFASENIENTAFLMVSKTSWYMAMPVSGTLMIIYTLAAIWRLLHQPSGQRSR